MAAGVIAKQSNTHLKRFPFKCRINGVVVGGGGGVFMQIPVFMSCMRYILVVLSQLILAIKSLEALRFLIRFS